VHRTVHLATWTFQSIQNYLYKLSGKRLSGKMIVRETSCMGNNRRVRARSCPGNVFPGNVLSGKVIVRETSCPGIVLSGKGLVREMSCPGNVLSGKRLSGKVIVRETSVTRLTSPNSSPVKSLFSIKNPSLPVSKAQMLWPTLLLSLDLHSLAWHPQGVLLISESEPDPKLVQST